MCAVTIEQLRGETYTGSDSVVEGMYARNAKHLDEVLAGVRGGSVVPLLGAGFSAGSIPLWRGALLGWARELGPAVEDEVTTCLDAGDFERAASLVESETGANAFRDAFRETFGEGVLDGAFDGLTPERRGISSAFRGFVLTTNYDRLVERAYEAAGAPIERVCPHTAYQFAQAAGGLGGNERLLLKLHGDAWDPTNAVITRGDYDRAYGTDSEVAPLVEVMRRAFAGRRVLFLGCSLAGDRPLDVLHGCCEGMTHYALVELPAETENPGDPLAPALVGPDGGQAPAYRDMRLRLDALGIRPIWYPHGQHEALDALLGWLEKEMGPLPGRASARLAPIPESTYGVVGREREVGDVVASLSNKPSVTLVTGPGGIGKTEVCREALRRLRDSGRDIVYAETVGKESAWGQCDAVADALGVPRVEHREGVRAAGYADHLTEKLGDLERPVVYLDNWEDAWIASDEEGRRELVSLLRALRGGSSVLVSSREIAADYETGARTVKIHALGKRASADLFHRVFCMKGGSLEPSGPGFEELIGKLEGHPLAIVLTATLATRSLSWSDVLSCWPEAPQHAENPRHNSLETALRLSWDAVANVPLTRVLWGVMALTPGDLPRMELDALADLSGTDLRDWVDTYARLRDASLMFASSDGSLSMLRPVREAFFQLTSDDLVDRCLDLLTRRLVEILEADDNGSGVPGIGPAHALALASLPRALFLLDHSLNLRGLGMGTRELAWALDNYYQFDRGLSQSVLNSLSFIAERDAETNEDYNLAALAARISAQNALRQDNLNLAEKLLLKAEDLHRKSGNSPSLANDLRVHAVLNHRQDKLDDSEKIFIEAESLHRQCGYELGLAYDFQEHAWLAIRRGELRIADGFLAEAEVLHRRQNDDLGLADDLMLRADLSIRIQDYERAELLVGKAKDLHDGIGDRLGLANDYQILAELAMRHANYEEANLFLNKAERLHQEEGSSQGLAKDSKLRDKLASLQR